MKCFSFLPDLLSIPVPLIPGRWKIKIWHLGNWVGAGPTISFFLNFNSNCCSFESQMQKLVLVKLWNPSKWVQRKADPVLFLEICIFHQTPSTKPTKIYSSKMLLRKMIFSIKDVSQTFCKLRFVLIIYCRWKRNIVYIQILTNIYSLIYWQINLKW